MKIQSSLLLFFISTFTVVYAQQNKIDSLLSELKKYDAKKSASGIHSPTITDSTKANILLFLANAYRLVNNDSAGAYAKQSLELAQQIKYKKGIGNAYSGVGAYLISIGNLDSALYCFEKTRDMGMEIGDKRVLANAYNNIGAYYYNHSNYSEALKNFLISLQLREALGKKQDLISAYHNIGGIYYELRKIEEAMQYHKKALALSIELNDIEHIADAYNSLAINYAMLEKYDEALKNYSSALKIYVDNGYKAALPQLYQNIGDMYKDIADDLHQKHVSAKAQENYNDSVENYFDFRIHESYETALMNYSESIKYSEETGNNLVAPRANIKAGAVYETLGDLDKALEYEEKGLAQAKNASMNDFVKEAYRTLAMIHFKKKNYKEAFENEQLYLQMYQQIYNEETKKNITQLQMQYEFDKKEAVARTEAEKQKLIRNVIYSGMGVAVVFLVVLLIQRSKIAKERRQIALEQERTRISRDLHDDLGSGLTGILMMSEQLHPAASAELVINNLEKIKKSSRQMVEQMGEIVWAMNSKNDTLENLMGYLNTYARDYFENTNISQLVKLPESIPHAVMTGMKRRNIFLVLKESFNNIAKHANASHVILNMEIEKNHMNITVADNGRGFEMGQTRRFGNGLKNMQIRMTNIHGTYQIESAIDKGTTTIISVPLA
jgi:signal transduction histidine kinase